MMNVKQRYRLSVLKTVKRLKKECKSRKHAVLFVAGAGYSLAHAYKMVRRVYGNKFVRNAVKPVKRVEESKTSLYEFCLVPSVDLGVLAGRYRKIYFMDAEGV